MHAAPLFPHGLKGLIFDCDGVLVDSRDANIAYYNMVLRELGKPPMTPAQEAYTHMSSSWQAMEHITTPDELRLVPAICARIPYSQTSLPLLQLEPGLMQALEAFRAAGLPLAVHTNRGAGMADVLDKFNLRPMFDPVMTVREVPPKPDPGGVRVILQAWGLPPGQVAFVGDSLTDAGAARAAGVPFVAYKNPDLEAALHVTAFAELEAALKPYVPVSTRS